MQSKEPQGYYSKWKLPTHLDIPESLTNLLGTLWGHRYKELYEEKPYSLSLEKAIGHVLDDLTRTDPISAHKRLIYMGWTMSLAARPTVQAHKPQDIRPDKVLEQVEAWVQSGKLDTMLLSKEIFLEPSQIEPPQALNEALSVFQNLHRTLFSQYARAAIEEIVDDCLTGYAIFPGSTGRRDLFNWWLMEVVPASSCLCIPQAIYTLKWPWPPKIESF